MQEVHTAPLASVWCWYRVGSRDEGPGHHRRLALGRAHELQGHAEHPARPGEGHHRAVRRQLERLHLDRPDHLSRDGDARRARPDALHRGRAHGRCLYDPADCESERTVIISELQGGENDPEQLPRYRDDRDRVQGPPVPASDHRLARRPPDDDPRRSLRALPTLLRARTTRRSSSSATSTPADVAAPRRAPLRRHRAAAPRPPAAHRRASPSRRRAPACSCAKPGRPPTGGRRSTRRRLADPDFFPLLALDAVLTGAAGLNSGPAAGCRRRSAAPGCTARSSTTRPGLVGRRRLAAHGEPFLYYHLPPPWPTARRWRRSRRPCSRECERLVARRHRPTTSSPKCRRSCGRASSSTATASPTSRISSATSHTIAAGRPGPTVRHRLARGDDRRSQRARRGASLSADNRTIGLFEPSAERAAARGGRGGVAPRGARSADSPCRRRASACKRRHRHRQGDADHSFRHDPRRSARRRVCRSVGAEGTAALVARVLDRGTSTRTAADIADDLDGRGASLSIVAGRQQVSSAPPASPRTSTPCCRRVRRGAASRRFPSPRSRPGAASWSPSIRQDEDDPAAMAVDALMASCIPTRIPTAAPARHGRERRGALTREQLAGLPPAPGSPRRRLTRGRGWRRRSERPPSTPSLRCSRTGRRARPPACRSRRRRRRLPAAGCVRRADDEQVAGRRRLRVRRHQPAATPTTTRRWVMNNALGQYALGGRLGDSIRERQGMAYYVFSSLDASLAAGPLMIRAGVAAGQRRAHHRVDRRRAEGPCSPRGFDARPSSTSPSST